MSSIQSTGYGYGNCLTPNTGSSYEPVSCLENIVGIRELCENNTIAEPTTGLFVDDLEGISIELAADIASGEYQTGRDLLLAKRRRAASALATDMRILMARKYRITAEVESVSMGEFVDPAQYIAGGNPDKYSWKPTSGNRRRLRGIEVSRECRSRFTRIHVSRIGIMGHCFDGLKTVNIHITEGRYVTTFTAEIYADFETWIPVNYRARGKRIYIVWDDLGTIRPNKSTLTSNNNCNSCRKSGYLVPDMLSVYGYDGCSRANYTYGLAADFGIVCDFEDLLCDYQSILGEAMLYRFGEEIIREAKTSTRLNVTTLQRTEQHNELEMKFNARYQELIHGAISTMDGSIGRIDPLCIQCNKGKYINTL